MYYVVGGVTLNFRALCAVDITMFQIVNFMVIEVCFFQKQIEHGENVKFGIKLRQASDFDSLNSVLNNALI